MSDEETWVTFSEIGINARMRNALELFAKRSPTHGPGSKELPAASEGIRERAAGLASVNEGNADGEERKQSAQSNSPLMLNSAVASHRKQA